MSIFGSERCSICPVCGDVLFHDESFDNENGIKQVINSYCYNCDIKKEIMAEDLILIKEFKEYRIFETKDMNYLIKDSQILLSFDDDIAGCDLLEILSNNNLI